MLNQITERIRLLVSEKAKTFDEFRRLLEKRRCSQVIAYTARMTNHKASGSYLYPGDSLYRWFVILEASCPDRWREVSYKEEVLSPSLQEERLAPLKILVTAEHRLRAIKHLLPSIEDQLLINKGREPADTAFLEKMHKDAEEHCVLPA